MFFNVPLVLKGSGHYWTFFFQEAMANGRLSRLTCFMQDFKVLLRGSR